MGWIRWGAAGAVSLALTTVSVAQSNDFGGSFGGQQGVAPGGAQGFGGQGFGGQEQALGQGQGQGLAPGAGAPAATGAVPPPFDPGPTVYIAVNGQSVGPLDAAGLRQKIAERALTPETLVWMPGMANWAPAGQTPMLQQLLQEVAQVQQGQPSAVEAFLTGTWVADPITQAAQGGGQMTITGQVTYGPARSIMVAGQARSPQGAIQINARGQYQVIRETPDSFTLREQMQVTMTAIGVQRPPQQQQLDETTTYRRMSPDVIVDDEGNTLRRRR